MSVAHALPITPADAREAEAATGIKHELVDGQLWAMAGGTPEHNLIASNTVGRLFMALLDRPCDVYNSDQLVQIGDEDNEDIEDIEDEASLYPDVSIYCSPQRSAKAKRAFTNPVALFEVMSPSSETYDRNRKFGLYRRLESLRHYVLLAQDRASAEVYDRNPDGSWTVRFVSPGEAMRLGALEVEIALDDVYKGVFND